MLQGSGGNIGVSAGESAGRVLGPLPALVGIAILGHVGLLDVGAEIIAQVLVEEREVDRPRGFVDVTGDLAQGTKDNEALRVFTANGYYDLATAYFANAYMMHHSGIDPARVTIRNYPAGHMMYLNQGSLEQLSRDIGEFIQGK